MKRRLIGSLAGLALAAGAMVATAVPAPAGILDPLDPQTFETVGTFEYIVPEGCTAVTVEAFGAEGGDSVLPPLLGGLGANGGSATSTLTVAGGESLQVNVGGEGGDASLIALSGGAAGANGGGTGGDGLIVAGGGGGGGGASDVRQGGTAVANRAVVAGGGGGGGAGVLSLLLNGDGGAGGATGTDGEDFGLGPIGLGGEGGQAGGNGGLGGNDGLLDITFGDGGDGAGGIGGGGGDGADLVLLDLIFGGGGGGGGLTGGGGGGAGAIGVGGGGGGGGDNLGTTHGEGVETGDGRVIITPVATSCVPVDPDRDCTDPPPLFFQPDATRETPRLGNDIYDDGSGDFQTQVEFVKPRFGSTLDIYIQNDGNQPDSFVLTGPAGAPPFLVRYQQLKAADGSLPKNYITEQVTGAGFTTGTLPACGEMKVRIQVKVSVNAQPGQEANLPLTVTSVGDGDVSDTARLIVRVVAP